MVGRYVELQPVILDVADHFLEVFLAGGLAQVTVDTEVITKFHIAVLLRGGQHDDGQQAGGGPVADFPQHVEAVQLGQFDVQQDQAG